MDMRNRYDKATAIKKCSRVSTRLSLRIRDLREDRDMTQAQMARLLNCSQQTYSRYESHTTEIPLESLIFLADYYDTSVDYLLGLTPSRKRYPEVDDL